LNPEEHKDFISAAMQILANRPGAQVLILIDSGRGLEMLQTNQSLVWGFGVLEVAKGIMVNTQANTTNQDDVEKRRKEASAEMEHAIKSGKGKAN
jgi:hypothetical protein